MDDLGPIFKDKEEQEYIEELCYYMDLQEKNPSLLRPFYDEDKDVKFFKDIKKLTTKSQELALDCIDWKEMLDNPIVIPLPCYVVFEPRKAADRLPKGKIWGVLMTFKDYGPGCRPRSDGVIFVCGDQDNEPPFQPHLNKLWDWALDTRNCPESMRFSSLAHSLLVLCGSIDSPFYVKNSRKDGYFQGSKCWKNVEWDMSLEDLMKQNVDFLEYSEKLPQFVAVRKNKKTRRKRKRLVENIKKNETVDTPFPLSNLDLIFPVDFQFP